MERLKGVKALAFSSIMASITILFILLTSYMVGVGIIAIITIPLISSFVSLKVDWKYRLVYFCACLITLIIDPSLTIFIVIPSLVSGIVLGQLIGKYIQGYYIIFITTLVVTALQILSTYLIDFVFEVNMIELFSIFLSIDIIDFSTLYFLFLFILSLIQVCLSYTIITNELKKLNIEFNERKNQFYPVFYYNIGLLILSVISFFVSKTLYYLSLGFTIYFGVILAYYIFSFFEKKKILIIQIPLYFLCILGFMILYSIVGNENAIILLLLPFLSQILTASYIIFYQKHVKKGTINESLFDKLN